MSKDRKPPVSRRADDDVVPYDGQEGAAPEPVASGSGRGSTALGAPRPGAPARTTPARPARDARPTGPARPASQQRRRARLALGRVEPWSVFVLSLLLGLFLGIVLLVAVGLLYALLQSLGVLESLDTFAQDLQLIDEGTALVSGGRVMGIAAVVAAVYVVALTALATLGAFLYNLCASLTGGVEVVLAERE